MKRTIIDPPSGWQYGFPRVLDITENETLKDWLLRSGYPPSLIPLAEKHSRYWEEDSPEAN
jgi:hypothetical protein